VGGEKLVGELPPAPPPVVLGGVVAGGVVLGGVADVGGVVGSA
jgi:hypothetical protein